MLVRRSKYVVPQIFSNPPYRPDDNSDDGALKEEYAAFVIGNFGTYRVNDFEEGGQWNVAETASLWDLYISWRDAHMKPWIRTVIDNIQSCVAAKKEASARFLARRRDVNDAETLAETNFADRADAILGIAGGDLDDPLGQENEYDDAPDAIDSAIDLAAVDALLEQHPRVNASRQMAAEYVASAAAAIPSVPHSVLLNCQPPANDEIIYRDFHTFSSDARKWKGLIKRFRRRDGTQTETTAEEETLSTIPKHYIQRENGTLKIMARLDAFDQVELSSIPILHDEVAQEGLSTAVAFVKLTAKPTMEEAIELHTLSVEQAFVFKLMADSLFNRDLACGSGGLNRLRLVVQGEPGTGKSQALIAFLWFAFQHERSDEVVVLSYAARAALNVSTISNVGRTTCSYFEIDGFSGDKPRRNHQAIVRLQHALAGKKIILIDEFSFISLSHMAACSEQCNLVSAAEMRRMHDNTWEALDHNFGHFHVVLFGDIFQHSPPGGSALHIGADICTVERELARLAQFNGSEKEKRNLAGRDVWESFNMAVILREQHRLTNDEDGEKLYRISRCFQRENVTREEIATACEELNGRAGLIDAESLGNENIKIVTLRQTVRHAVNSKLVTARAAVLNKRLYIWRSQDSAIDGSMLPASFEALLETVPASNLGDVPTVGYYFSGIEYTFVNNESTDAGYARNNICVGRSIFLDTREPVDDLTKPYRTLKYQPLGICVEPNLVKVGDLCGGDVPKNCIVVLPERRSSLSCVLPAEIKLPCGRVVKKIRFNRTGFPLDYGYAITDYFAQGLSFTEGRFYSHLNIPAEGPLSAESMYVSTTRYRRWTDLYLLCPLWPPATHPRHKEIRDWVIDRFFQATKRSESIRKEYTRLEELATDTLKRTDQVYQWCRTVVSTFGNGNVCS